MYLWEKKDTLELESTEQDSFVQKGYSILRKDGECLKLSWGFFHRLFVFKDADTFTIDVYRKKPFALIIDILLVSGVFSALFFIQGHYPLAVGCVIFQVVIWKILWERDSDPNNLIIKRLLEKSTTRAELSKRSIVQFGLILVGLFGLALMFTLGGIEFFNDKKFLMELIIFMVSFLLLIGIASFAMFVIIRYIRKRDF